METILRHHATGRRRAALAALASLAVLAACAGGGGARRASGGRQPGAVTNGQFAPARPQAQSYGPDAAGVPCPTGGAVAFAMADLEEAAERAGRPAPVLDPRVCAVAEAFLGWSEKDHGQPRLAVLSFVSSWFGLPSPVLPPLVVVLPTSDEKVIADRIVQAVGGSALAAANPRLGVAIQRQRRGKEISHRLSVTLLDAPVELTAPRRLDLGQEATVSGKLLGGYTTPKVLVSDASGQLSSPEQQPGDSFTAPIRCGDRPGTILVEVRGEKNGDATAVATLPIACGRELATAVALQGEKWPSDPAVAEKRAFDLVNAERKAAGLEPVAWDPAVAIVAKRVAGELASSGGAGADVAGQLRREGIVSPLVLQSAAADRSFDRAHERLLASPSNRANLMHPEATHGAVGAVSTADAEGRPIVYLSEVLIRELPPVDPQQARAALREAVARKRKDARATPLAEDDTLEATAQRFAEALAQAQGQLPKEKQSELTSPLTKAYKTVTMVAGAKQDPLEFAEEPQATAAGKGLGVGVARGKHPVLGRNATYVVLMVGTKK
jgi:uncharacterized protein YkwD